MTHFDEGKVERSEQAPVNGYEALARQNEAMKQALEQYRFLHGNDPVAERIGSKPYCECQQCKLSYKALALTQDRKVVQKL
jgi:hypothetical protein